MVVDQEERMEVDQTVVNCNNKLRFEKAMKVNCIQAIQYTDNHMRLFYSINQLHLERKNPDMMYVVDKWFRVFSIKHQPGKVEVPKPVEVHSDYKKWRFMHTNETLDWTLYQPTLTFPNERMALMTDGQGYMALFKTGDRTQQKPWEMVTWYRRPTSYVFHDSIVYHKDNCEFLLFFAGHLKRDERSKQHCNIVVATPFCLDLEECKFVSRPDSRTEIALQVLDTQDVKYVSAFGDRGKDKKMSYCILSRNQEFGIDFREDVDRSQHLMVWSQEKDMVKAKFKLAGDTRASDVKIGFHPDYMTIEINDRKLLKASLFKTIVPDKSHWYIPQDKEPDGTKVLVVDVTKFYEGVPWSDFFLEFIRGEQTFTAEEEKKVLSEMMVFNSENLDKSPNTERQIEEEADMEKLQCGEVINSYDEDKELKLCFIDYDGTCKPKALNPISIDKPANQWLFNTVPRNDKDIASFCVKRGDDAVVFTPEVTTKGLVTACSFKGLGTKLAEMKRRRFVACPEDMSYVAVADMDRNVFIYKFADGERSKDEGQVKLPVSEFRVAYPEDPKEENEFIYDQYNSSAIGLVAMNDAVYFNTRKCLYKQVIA